MEIDLPTKRFRYRVTSVWGSMVGRIEPGMVVISYDYGEKHDWQVWIDGSAGGWSGDFVDEVSDPRLLSLALELDRLHGKGDQERMVKP